MKIPCKQCPVLAMCRSKSYIKCSILATLYNETFNKAGHGKAALPLKQATLYLKKKQWSVLGDEVHIYTPLGQTELSEAEENRLWQLIGDRDVKHKNRRTL